MENKMTMEAAIIAANRLLTVERMEIDREEMTAAIRKLIDAAQFRIKLEPIEKEHGVRQTPVGTKPRTFLCCPNCENVVPPFHGFCPECGQALDWSAAGCYKPLSWSSL